MTLESSTLIGVARVDLRCALCSRQGGGEPKCAAPARFARRADRASHQIDKLPGYREAQTRSAKTARGGGILLLEGIEQPLRTGWIEANPCIAHLAAHQARLVGARRQPNDDLACLGELDRVAHQVHEHLTQAVRVPLHPVREPVVDEHRELESLAGGLLGQQAERCVHKLAQRERVDFEPQLPGFDLGEVEDVVEGGHQGFGGELHAVGIVPLLQVKARVEQQLGHPDDTVHRRTDLVAHVGEKLRLQARGLERVVARDLEPFLRPPALDELTDMGADALQYLGHLRVPFVSLAAGELQSADCTGRPPDWDRHCERLVRPENPRLCHGPRGKPTPPAHVTKPARVRGPRSVLCRCVPGRDLHETAVLDEPGLAERPTEVGPEHLQHASHRRIDFATRGERFGHTRERRALARPHVLDRPSCSLGIRASAQGGVQEGQPQEHDEGEGGHDQVDGGPEIRDACVGRGLLNRLLANGVLRLSLSQVRNGEKRDECQERQTRDERPRWHTRQPAFHSRDNSRSAASRRVDSCSATFVRSAFRVPIRIPGMK